MNNKIDTALGVFERKIFRLIIRLINVEGQFRELIDQFGDIHMATHMKL